MRREVSWLLPTATESSRVTREHLSRFCRMLFEDPESRRLFEWFAKMMERHLKEDHKGNGTCS